MIKRATNLDEVNRACNPARPLESTDDRYVDLSRMRGMEESIATTIARNISRCDESEYYQQLLTGHRGCGKTTELLRLKSELESRKFFTVYFDIQDLIDLDDLSYIDVLLNIATQIEKSCRIANIRLDKKLLANLFNWFDEIIIENKYERTATAEISVKIPLLVKLMGGGRINSTQRKIIRRKLEQEQSTFIKKLNDLISNARDKIRENQYRDLVVIVDGLEKERISALLKTIHTHVFIHHAKQLKSPCCHIIYTMPIFLEYNADLSNDFDNILFIPMVRISPDGIICLRELIAKRIEIKKVFSSTALLDELSRLSGGVVRDLMLLIRLSLSNRDNGRINAEDIKFVKQKITRSYDIKLYDEYIEPLKVVHKEKRVPSGKKYTDLLDKKLILEYQNGKRWADLHPVILEVDRMKKHFTSIILKR